MFQFFSLRSSPAAFVLLFLLAGPALAHEYWIEPRRFEVPSGGVIEGDLRNGQDFRGSAFSYISSRFERFTVSADDAEAPVTGREGDMPALKFRTSSDGLHVAAYQGKFDRILFNDWERFLYYLDYEGLEGIEERHKARGLPETRFVEQYQRCAKALFSVGEGSGSDRLTGMRIELVAEGNPYADGVTSIPIRLYWEGEPLAGRQVNVFRDNGEVALTRFHTDAEGRFILPLDGGGKFLINSVMMIEGDNDPDTETAEWQSFWASLVFATHGADALLHKLPGN